MRISPPSNGPGEPGGAFGATGTCVGERQPHDRNTAPNCGRLRRLGSGYGVMVSMLDMAATNDEADVPSIYRHNLAYIYIIP